MVLFGAALAFIAFSKPESVATHQEATAIPFVAPSLEGTATVPSLMTATIIIPDGGSGQDPLEHWLTLNAHMEGEDAPDGDNPLEVGADIAEHEKQVNTSPITIFAAIMIPIVILTALIWRRFRRVS